MSYSFRVVAASAALALVAVRAELDKVVETQPVHAQDRQAAEDAAAAQINLLAEPKEGEVVSVSVSGSLGWVAENTFTIANVSVHAGITPDTQT